MASTYTPIATTTLGSGASSVTFSSISGSYTDLILVCNAKSTANGQIKIQFNGDTGANYSATILGGDGSSAFSVSNTGTTSINIGGVVTEFGTTLISINNYSNSSTYKTAIASYKMLSSSYGEAGAKVGLWQSTSAITSVTVLNTSGSYVTGSMFTLYGIKAA